jgi:hypothetical protein
MAPPSRFIAPNATERRSPPEWALSLNERTYFDSTSGQRYAMNEALRG